MKKIIAISTLLLVLTGCNEEEANTVSYYLENEQEREQKLSECRDDIAAAVKDGNCINANDAENTAAQERRSSVWESGSNIPKPEM